VWQRHSSRKVSTFSAPGKTDNREMHSVGWDLRPRGQ